ncbi:phosphoserine transaminase [Burkholderia oklahomensis]|uniref:Phosphoserine aminotransferase n=1 Tax=Burkholderia oklahomensis TaxID=342113 RepID=A0AAI8B507_9BURK|nr:phosphoserine transaminase [Burkholderia oklahomensis]AIO65740.1 phosphoserine aminotransferase [Burkholderia oklahomensis]AOI41976.1 3-phosphoserine/phosphohydroxythreonine aminotransferase [Burkholderia oklahomensis EO147]KUY61384.1 3-phosphoserine/phosphohydroxythreonine aminotransferase [Burkholderia oklahomensis EO147]QPS36718.1 phosphoserine transaminase [Burkholderia oklahomensis]
MHRNQLNFSGGPGALPDSVLEQVRQAVVELPETGLSVLGMSHRSGWFSNLLAQAEADLRELLGISNDYGVVFLQGGSSLQFSMIPMNFSLPGAAAPEYVTTGYWSRKAIGEASRVAAMRVVWDGAAGGYRTLPPLAALDWDARASFRHYVSNETVEGLQFPEVEDLPGSPLIADMSSDFMSRPFSVDAYGMVYAHAQKNLGPAGVTVAIIRRALLERIPDTLPPMLDFRTHVEHRSNYNTPPVFAIYVMALVLRWIRDDIGGVGAMRDINARKAAALYATLDALDEVIDCHAQKAARSTMNVAFRFRDARLDTLFKEKSAEAGLSGLSGHRSIGGIRASLYNAVSEQAVGRLTAFLKDFAIRHA